MTGSFVGQSCRCEESRFDALDIQQFGRNFGLGCGFLPCSRFFNVRRSATVFFKCRYNKAFSRGFVSRYGIIAGVRMVFAGW
jgi:hypothetical protein